MCPSSSVSRAWTPGMCAASHGPVLPRSMRITGSVAKWESWTRMRFPETGDYVLPAALATVHSDRGQDTGRYWEPNVWLVHRIRPAG